MNDIKKLESDIKKLGFTDSVVEPFDYRGQIGMVLDHPGRFTIKKFSDLGYKIKLLADTKFVVLAEKEDIAA